MNVSIKGKGNYSLTKSDFVASGGEGSVYRKGKTAFKIYTDPQRMIPTSKIQELSVLTLPNIIRPKDIIYDSKNNAVGYTMDYVTDTFALCQLFTKSFRDRFNIKPTAMTKLVNELRLLVSHVHSKDILIVDLNEMNFLVNDGFDEMFAIDCDSYQTKNHKATAIMESIRDRHSKTFSNETDWFSFAIISFQMFIGIHPYKGKHDKLKTMDERMLKNVSVLNKKVSIPAVCYPFTNIPQSYLDYYKAVFEDGKRLPPPDELQPVIIIPRAIKIVGSNNFIIAKLRELAEEIIRYDPIARLSMTTVALYSDSREEYKLPAGKRPVLGMTPFGQVIAADIFCGKLRLHNVSMGTPVKFSGAEMSADAVMSYDGNIYFKNADSIYILVFFASAADLKVAAQRICSVLENATKLFDGVIMQDVLGACYAYVMKEKACYQIHLKELDAFRIIDAKYDNKVLMVLGFDGGKYEKFIFRLDDTFQEYDVRIEHDVGCLNLNFVVLPKGICAHLNDREELELFSNAKGSASLKVINDPALDNDMKLSRDGNQVVFGRGETLYSIELKKVNP